MIVFSENKIKPNREKCIVENLESILKCKNNIIVENLERILKCKNNICIL